MHTQRALRALRVFLVEVARRPSITAHELDTAIALSLSGGSSRAAPRAGHGSATSEGPSDPDQDRIAALVELAVGGDVEAFGALYDHYVDQIFRFVYYRVGSRQLAEDLTGDTFVRALNAVPRFTWQGKDFGAWLTTIARNLVTDHYKSARNRLEIVSEEVPERGVIGAVATPSPEDTVLSRLGDENLLEAVRALPQDQQDCIVMRFLLEYSIAQTAEVMDRSSGAIKQLQLRAIRSLAALLPQEQR